MLCVCQGKNINKRGKHETVTDKGIENFLPTEPKFYQ